MIGINCIKEKCRYSVYKIIIIIIIGRNLSKGFEVSKGSKTVAAYYLLCWYV